MIKLIALKEVPSCVKPIVVGQEFYELDPKMMKYYQEEGMAKVADTGKATVSKPVGAMTTKNQSTTPHTAAEAKPKSTDFLK